MSEPVHGGPVVDYVKEAVDRLYHVLGEDEAAVSVALRAFYQKYIKPIDLPYVPNLGVEPMVDAALEDWFVKGIQKAHDAIHTEG
jgi:hypothetical protein